MEGQNVSPRPPDEPDSDVTSAAGFGGGDNNSEYVDSTENAPTSSAITPDLVGHTSNRKLCTRSW